MGLFQSTVESYTGRIHGYTEKIVQMVYELYDLTAEEINVVRGER